MTFEGKPPTGGARDGNRGRYGSAGPGHRSRVTARGKGGNDRRRQKGQDRTPRHQGDHETGFRHDRKLGGERQQGRSKPAGRDGDRDRQVSRDSRGDRRGSRGIRFPEGKELRRVPKPGTAPARNEPATPEDFDESSLPAGVRAELKGLPKDLAATVGAHVLAAGELLDVDPELAYRHAEAARRRAGRLPAVREAAAETAYASGHYDIALREFRAIRRMNGGDELLPVLADCERALGRHREALDLLATLNPGTKDLGLRIECILVEAGIRSDLGQRGEALRLLKSAISRQVGPKLGRARLRYAYADLLEREGRPEAAREWFESAARLDPGNQLDVAERIAVLDGVALPEDFDLGPMAGNAPETLDGRTDVADLEDAIPTQAIDLVSPEEEIAEILTEIEEGRE